MRTRPRSITLRRLSLAVALLGVAFAGILAGGCATQGTAAVVDSNEPFVVELSDQFVTVQNRTGSALVNVSVVLVPVQGSPFTAMVPRVENQQRHQIAVKSLRTSQGTAFNPMFAQPLTVLVSASNVSGQRYETKVPWR